MINKRETDRQTEKERDKETEIVSERAASLLGNYRS